MGSLWCEPRLEHNISIVELVKENLLICTKCDHCNDVKEVVPENERDYIATAIGIKAADMFSKHSCGKSGYWLGRALIEKCPDKKWTTGSEHFEIRDSTKQPCCGKAGKIVKGFALLYTRKLLRKPLENWAKDRLDTCLKCEYRTWLPLYEWGTNVLEDELPVNHEAQPGDVLWCSKCKCCLEAKVLVKSTDCDMGRWDNIRDVDK